MSSRLARRFLQKGAQQQALVQKAREKQQAGASVTNESFREYIARVKPDFKFHRWCELLICRLQEVADGKLHRLLVQVPPRHGKSELCKLFAGYYLLRYQNRYVGVSSYSMDLAATFSRAARNYYQVGGGRFNPAAQSVQFWETESLGGCWAAGSGGSITGKGGHCIVLDDPVKGREEAESPAYIRKLHDWYKSTLRTRLNPEDGALVIVQTRWSAVDAIGLVLDLEEQADPEDREGWHLIDLPAEAEPWEMRPPVPECVTIEEDWREVGEALCPQRYPLSALRKIRAAIGSREYGALYQQNPVANDAAIFQPSWWRYRRMDNPTGEPIEYTRKILSVDCAFTATATSDFVAIAAFGERPDGTIDMIDLINERLDVVGTMAAVRAQVQRHHPAAVLIEAAANGHAVIQMMRRKIPHIIPIKPDKSKVARAQGAAPMVEAGSVYLPPDAHWLNFFLQQTATFPVGKNDDATDAFTQAINWMRDRGPQRITTTTWGRTARR
ncbi:MAG: phage terminase large subunit [Synechococcus sp.]